jgi:hypothetical protein
MTVGFIRTMRLRAHPTDADPDRMSTDEKLGRRS